MLIALWSDRHHLAIGGRLDVYPYLTFTVPQFRLPLLSSAMQQTPHTWNALLYGLIAHILFPCLFSLKNEAQILTQCSCQGIERLDHFELLKYWKLWNFLCPRKHGEVISAIIDPEHLSLRWIIDINVRICFPLDHWWIETRSGKSPEWYIDFKCNPWAFR